MKVLIVSCVYPPEPVVSAKTSSQIAEELRRTGNTVMVVTSFPNRPAGKIFPGYSRSFVQRERSVSGVEIARCFSTVSPESRLSSRFLENLSFGLTAGWVVLTTRRPDVIYSNTWPVFATGILWLVARFRRIPMVVSIQDVYPESLISQQRIRSGSWPARVLRKIDGLIGRGCAAVIVISPSIAATYHCGRGVPPERTKVIPNWIDRETITYDDPQAAAVRANLKMQPGARLAVYGGNIGVAAGVETLIESLRFLDDEARFRLLVAGEGSQLATCQCLAQQVRPNRVAFHSPWPTGETSSVLGAADFLILPTRGQQSFASVPSKLITYMLSGRPVLALACPNSDLAKTITESGCGWVVQPDRPDLLAAQIRRLMSVDSEELTQRGLAGREFALEHFTKEICLPKVIDILRRVVA